MPDIREECPPLLPTLALINSFFEDPSPEFGQYRKAVVRWIDKAISEYSQAREAILAQIEEQNRTPEEMARTGRQIYMFDFSYAIEHCLMLTRRLLRALERMNSLPEVQIDRTVRKYLQSQSQNLVDARNFAEHIVEMISGGKLPEKGSLFARLSQDHKGVEVGGDVVPFSQLASTLRKFYSIAQHLVDTESGLEDGQKS